MGPFLKKKIQNLIHFLAKPYIFKTALHVLEKETEGNWAAECAAIHIHPKRKIEKKQESHGTHHSYVKL